jgi:GT2 family glycosyltransferase
MNVGGLDADAFAVAFNDVDFCLKLQAAGLRNLYVPSVSLIHHESVSRGSDYAPANLLRFNGELSRFQARWRSAECRDPHYSPLFSRSSEQCLLTF